MLSLQSITAASYADKKNARFKDGESEIRSIKERWDETYKALPKAQQRTIDVALDAAVSEFQRRNPKFFKLTVLAQELAEAKSVKMSQVFIDNTMQRQLNIAWVLALLNTFIATRVMPIQVYRPDPTKDEYVAWDGQHTLVTLWLICTQIFGEDYENFTIPVCVYASHQKAEMRGSFIDLNSEVGKKTLDLYDKFEQMLYAVRTDGSTNPDWEKAEKKQRIIEECGLFVTSKKFGDDDMPGAISRMQEINKLHIDSLKWLCLYLVAVGAQTRPVEEKELVMMSYFFEKCRLAGMKLTQKQIFDIANVTKNRWGADFSPSSPFWGKVQGAYRKWHTAKNVGGTPKPKKEPIHGFPFLAEQIKKDLKGFDVLSSNSSSEFVPAQEDLYKDA